MSKYETIHQQMKDLVAAIDEPAFIAMNIGEATMFAQNDLMLSSEQSFKSSCYHCINISLATCLCDDGKYHPNS